MSEKLYRELVDGAEAEAAEIPRIAPGRMAATARLAPRAQRTIILRVEDAAAASTLADRFGARDGNGVAHGADALVDRASSSAGAPLPGDVRTRFESSLGADLSGVRVHTGAESAVAASAVGAHAYTVGQDIHFAEGKFAPSDPFGLHLLAHEVAHTVQQAGGASRRQHKLEVSTPGDGAELEADRAADAMVRGDIATIAGAPVSVGRVVLRGKDDGAAPAGGAPVDTVGGEFTVKDKVLGKAHLGPYAEVELKLGGSVKFGASKAAEKKPADGGKSSGPSKEEAETAAKEKVDGVLAKAVAEAKGEKGISIKGDKKSISLAPSFTLSTEVGPVKLEFAPIEISLASWDKEKGLSGPKFAANVAATIPVFKTTVKGVELEIAVSGSVAAEITPDYKAIAQWVLTELGVSGAVELAGTLAIATAPLLCLASSLALSADEAALAAKIAEFGKDGKHAALCLATATMGSDMAASTPAQQKAIADGKAAAAQASAVCGMDAYKAGFDSAKASQLVGQCDRQTRMGYESKVRQTAEESFGKSFNWKFWKTKEDAVADAMKVLSNVWP